MISVGLDSTLFIQMAQFLVIVVLVNFFIIKPIKKAMDSRDEKIQSLHSQAKANLTQIENKKKEYEERLAAVRTEISDYQNQLRNEAASRTQAILDKVKQEVNVELEAARKVIEQEAENAKKSLQGDVSALTENILQAVSK